MPFLKDTRPRGLCWENGKPLVPLTSQRLCSRRQLALHFPVRHFMPSSVFPSQTKGTSLNPPSMCGVRNGTMSLASLMAFACM